MGHIRTRRVTALAGALLTATSGLIIGLGAGQASAKAALPTFALNSGFDRTVPVRANGLGEGYRPVSVSVDTYGRALFGVQVAVDASKTKGLLDLVLPSGCSYTDAAHLHALCTLGDLPSGHGEVDLSVRAAAGAAAGGTATIDYTATATGAVEEATPDGRPISSTVTVADGPDLAVNDLGATIKAPAGAQTALPLQISNIGSSDAKGVIVFVRDQYDNGAVLGNFSNCVYEAEQRGAQCTFPDAVVKPNETYQLATPFTLDLPAGAHGDQIQYGAGLTGDDWIGQEDGKKGTGGELALVKVAHAPAHRLSADPSQDIDAYNNLYYSNLDTGVADDLAAVAGSPIHGTVGKASNTTVGVRNSGDTTFSKVGNVGPGLAEGTVGVFVAFPSQVTVTKAPKACVKEDSGPDGAVWSGGGAPVAYACSYAGSLAPGAEVTFAFGVKPLQVLDNAFAGVVALGHQDVTANTGDDVAKLSIDAAKAGATPTAKPTATGSATAAPSPAPSASATGGALASTGGGGDATPIALSGAVAVALGAGAVFAVRRRRAGSHS